MTVRQRLIQRLRACTTPLLPLASRPLTLAALLVLPAWVMLGNFVVALLVSLLLAFFAAMLRTLWLLRRHSKKP